MEYDDKEINEHKALFSYNVKYQFLYCGNNGVSLCGQKFIVIVNKDNELFSFKTTEESSMSAIAGGSLFKYISEIDGLRYFSKDGVFLISQVSPELVAVSNPFDDKNPAKKLIYAYGGYLSKNADCDK